MRSKETTVDDLSLVLIGVTAGLLLALAILVGYGAWRNR
jgi:hypothetical protein